MNHSQLWCQGFRDAVVGYPADNGHVAYITGYESGHWYYLTGELP